MNKKIINVTLLTLITASYASQFTDTQRFDNDLKLRRKWGQEAKNLPKLDVAMLIQRLFEPVESAQQNVVPPTIIITEETVADHENQNQNSANPSDDILGQVQNYSTINTQPQLPHEAQDTTDLSPQAPVEHINISKKSNAYKYSLVAITLAAGAGYAYYKKPEALNIVWNSLSTLATNLYKKTLNYWHK